MRDAGAKEIHFRVSSPPITHSDFYGIDTPSRDQLLASEKNVAIKSVKTFIETEFEAGRHQARIDKI